MEYWDSENDCSRTEEQTYVCATCDIDNQEGSDIMDFAQALAHSTNFPDHKIVMYSPEVE